jgi:hypothetical protein
MIVPAYVPMISLLGLLSSLDLPLHVSGGALIEPVFAVCFNETSGYKITNEIFEDKQYPEVSLHLNRRIADQLRYGRK